MPQKLKLPIVLPELKIVEEELYKVIADTEGAAKDVCLYALQAGGKRLRPTLVLLSNKCFNGDIIPGDIIPAAVAAELIHLASLIHDDIIDNSQMRHGKKSVNTHWDNKIAVLAGDNLFAKAFKVLSKNRLYDVLELMVEAIEDMCSGEIEQAMDSFNPAQEEESYYRKISKKTAKLLAVCCQAGSLISLTGKDYASSLREFGLNLGYAFQITDDILDLTGQKKELGKPTGLDLAQGTLTLPMLSLLKNPKYGDWFKKEAAIV
jgi:heptaprenyl diphosphate synthase